MTKDSIIEHQAQQIINKDTQIKSLMNTINTLSSKLSRYRIVLDKIAGMAPAVGHMYPDLPYGYDDIITLAQAAIDNRTGPSCYDCNTPLVFRDEQERQKTKGIVYLICPKCELTHLEWADDTEE